MIWTHWTLWLMQINQINARDFKLSWNYELLKPPTIYQTHRVYETKAHQCE